MHVHFGRPDARSRVRVQFVCDPLQRAVVEWVRAQHSASFGASDAIAFAQQQQVATMQTHDGDDDDDRDGNGNDDSGSKTSSSSTTTATDRADAVKYVLRFLSTVGYISPATTATA